MVFFGAAIAGYMMVWSLIADIVNYDEYETGKRHEGSFYGLYTFVSKLAMAAGVLASGIFLDVVNLEKKRGGHQRNDQCLDYLRRSCGWLA